MVTSAQRFIQPMAQANTPFVPNNGNPNTVYNTAATPFGGAAVAPPTGAPNMATGWADIAPFGGTNIRQHWSFPPASTTPPVSAFANESAQFWRNMTGLTPAQYSLAESGAVWPAGDAPFMPAPAPGPGGGSGVEQDIHPHDPNFRPTPVGTGGSNRPASDSDLGSDWYHQLTQGNNMGGVGTLPLNPNPGASIPSGSPQWLQEMGNAVGNGWDGLKEALGFRGDSISAMQVLDWFLPGDLVDANTGRINWDQAAKTALNMLTPGLGSLIEAALDNGIGPQGLVDLLAGMKFERGAIEQSRQQGITIDEMQRDLFEQLAPDMFSRLNIPFNVRDIPMGNVSIGPLTNPNTTATPQTGNTAIGADTATGSEVSNPFDRSPAQQGQAPVPPAAGPAPGRGHRAAGSNTIAEGAAAQDMFAGMTDYNAQQRAMDAQQRAMEEFMGLSNQMR